jgi:hypothetical protein
MNVDDLLQVDASVASESLHVFKSLCEDSLVAADLALELYRHASERVATDPGDDKDVDALLAIAAKHNVPAGAFVAMLHHDADGGHPAVIEGQATWRRLWSARAKQLLLELSGRYYRWGVTDLRRLRLTATQGYLRLQAECVGLLLIFAEDETYAIRFLNPKDDSLKFYKQTQPKLKKHLKERDLFETYEIGSSVSLHARASSAARGWKTDGLRIHVFDQEFDPHDPFSLHLGIAHYLRIQSRILEHWTASVPWLASDSEFSQKRSNYREVTDKIWWVLERKYPAEIAALGK